MITSRKGGEDRDIVTMKTNKKSYVAYRMTPLPMLLNDLEGHFAV